MSDKTKRYKVNVIYEDVIVLSMEKERDNDTELKEILFKPGKAPFTY